MTSSRVLLALWVRDDVIESFTVVVVVVVVATLIAWQKVSENQLFVYKNQRYLT
jgi:hypothetical protein